MAVFKTLLEVAEEMRRELLKAYRANPTEESARRLADIEVDIASLEHALELVGMREVAGARDRAGQQAAPRGRKSA